MPDISMCKNEECRLRKYCYRYIVEPDEMLQAYGSFESKEEVKQEGLTVTCDYFWLFPQNP